MRNCCWTTALEQKQKWFKWKREIFSECPPEILVDTSDFLFFSSLFFPPTWVSLHPTRERSPESPWRRWLLPLDSFVTTRRARRSPRHAKTTEIPLITSQQTSAPALFWTIQICAPPATNDLGKQCHDVLPQEQPIKSSELLELDVKNCDNR